MISTKTPTHAISPAEAFVLHEKQIPPGVFQCWNELIIKNYISKKSVFVIKQDDIIALITETLSVSRQDVFNNGWLEVEQYYSKSGWTVQYESPDRGDNWSPFFRFRAVNS